ncbi:MAG: tRNA (cytidine(34)-2'-O)-methyltransferase [Myxococcales bacterium]|nr:tRNA (cytidine(34)-2'-O)-methyltransferase [Myxococcales bacterium]
MQIALINPLIPQNTGSVARLAAATNTPLHLVGELGFSLDDRYLKRAGLDYWPAVRLCRHAGVDTFLEAIAGQRLWLFSTHASRRYTDVDYRFDDVLVFGSETTGIPDDLRRDHSESLLRIPINGNVRSLNLANSAAIVLFEGLRQCGFPDEAVAHTTHPAVRR